jgi:hypothetical protein
MAMPAEKTATPDAHMREAPTLKPAAVVWQSDAFHAWREAMVKLPKEMLLEDLIHVPTVWKLVQSQNQSRVRRFDRLTLINESERWAVKDVMVIAASNTAVHLALRASDRITLPAPLPGEIGPEIW